MRLGIRRKLIGTLILVGLFPLAMSLTVILGGGAATQISRIRNNYEVVAANCSDRIADTILRDELKTLTLIARSPVLMVYLREHNRLRTLARLSPDTLQDIIKSLMATGQVAVLKVNGQLVYRMTT